MTLGAHTMTFFRQDFLGPAVAMFLLVLMTYIAGRIHQFFKQTTEREQAFREGYNSATRSLFSLATQTARAVKPRPSPKPIRGFASVEPEARSPLPARHRAAGRRGKNLADTKRIELDKAA
jgi:hypothetical protein